MTHLSLNTLRLVLITVAMSLHGFAVGQSGAGQVSFALDPAATTCRWTLDSNVHTSRGTFKLKRGEIHLDPPTGNASGLIVFDATSGESGDAARDKAMHAKVLESARYPDITFRPRHVTLVDHKALNGTATVDGIFTLHGQDHPLQLTVELKMTSVGEMLTTHFKVPFVAWGLKDPSTFIFRVEKDVQIDLQSLAVAPGAR